MQALGQERGSLLRGSPLSAPRLQIGSLYATRAWGVEEHYMLRLEYHHCGYPKTW